MSYTRISSAAAVLLGFILTPVSAATLYFDFGDSAQTTANNYNNIIVNPPGVLSIANSIDSTGAPTGIGITVAGFFNGSNQNGTTAPTGAAAIFDPQATRDNAFGHAGPFGVNPLTPSATVSFTGLNPAQAYNFTFFGSRTGVTDNRETEYAVTGSNAGSALLNTSSNISNVAVVSGILPTGAGTIQVVVDPGPNNNNSSLFYYLGALELSTSIPEPASILLLMSSVAGLLVCRGPSCRS